MPSENTPNGRVRLEEEKSRSAVTSMSVCKVLPVACLKRLMRSSAVATVSQQAVETSDNTTTKEERRQSMKTLKRGEWDKKGQSLKAKEKKMVDGCFLVF